MDFEIIEYLGTEWVLAEYKLLCPLEKFKMYLEDNYDLDIYSVKCHVDYGDGEYGYDYYIDWSLVAHDYYNGDYLKKYIEHNNIIFNNLKDY